MSATAMGMLTKAGAIHRVSDGYKDLPSMKADYPGSEGFIGDAFSNPEGAPISSGYFELRKSEPLIYEYTYDEMKVVIQGEFLLTDQATGESLVARERDVLFFPKGTTVKFETPDYALGFYVGARTFAP